MLVLISYDISDDRRRTRLAHRLEDFGRRVQLSVFECWLEPTGIAELEAATAREIDPEVDSLRLYLLCGQCHPRVRILGVGELTHDPEVYVL